MDRQGLQLHMLTFRRRVVPVISILTVFRLMIFSPPFRSLGLVQVDPFPLISPVMVLFLFPRARV